jgi:hypothetical protein
MELVGRARNLLRLRKLRAGSHVMKTKETVKKPMTAPRNTPGTEKISVNVSFSELDAGVVTFLEVSQTLVSGAPQSPGLPGRKEVFLCVCSCVLDGILPVRLLFASRRVCN